ncbi:Lysosomal alpha-glucosidase [Toxocara canis]|uniref:Lysosomal alpha-glucosidase n=1 Tax=Toxocara canis TaxID=6265 RepID=A0A0B2W2F9_TOXCA|nr:Lysosomal alpha-glucosidase [Toxocara canis]
MLNSAHVNHLPTCTIVTGADAFKKKEYEVPHAEKRSKDFEESWIGLNDYAKELHTNGLTLTLVVDPTVQADSSAFQRALEQDVGFIEWPQTELVQTEVNQIHPLAKETKIMFGIGRSDRHVAFPDFLDPLNKTTAWWMDEIKQLHFTANFDGVWLDMNEPANLGADKHRHSKWDRKQLAPLKCPLTGLNAHFDVPPYQTANVYQWGFENVLSTKTLCMLATTSRNKTRFYDTKNLYGLSQTIATQTAINYATAKRGLVVSRSTFPSSGHYAGHWIDGTIGRWEDLRTSLIAIQEFNMFGIPYVGSNVHTICNSDVADELCIRWQQLGAFQSLSRYHNGNIGAPYNPKVLEAIRQANLFRYQYLPYLYSLHFNASMKGGSVLRPVFFEFPDDKNTHDLGYQFMWGSAVMVVPAVYPGQNTVSGYLPTGAIWYSLRETEYGQLVQGGHQEFSARIDELPPVFLKGGTIISRQRPNTTTTASRMNPFEIIIALDANGMSPSGELYWDDGDSVVSNDDFKQHAYSHWTFSMNHANFENSSVLLTLTPTKIAVKSFSDFDNSSKVRKKIKGNYNLFLQCSYIFRKTLPSEV